MSTDPVLVAVDGSEESIAALRWAGWFAAATGRSIVAAHVWEHGRPLLDADGSEWRSQELTVAAEVATLVRREVDDSVAAEVIVPVGEPAEALTAAAAEREAGLVVVGSSGTQGAVRTLMGSVSLQITERPVFAVAVVPAGVPAREPGPATLLVGVDGSDGASRAVRWCAAFAARTGSDVVAVHALQPPVADASPDEVASLLDEARHRLEDEWCAPLVAAGAVHRAVVREGPPLDVIGSVAAALHPAAVVVGSHGAGALSARLLGSVARSLTADPAWPVVVVPSPSDRMVWSP